MGTEKNKIETLLDDMADYLESCKPVPFSSSKVMVSKDDIYDLIDALKVAIPEEIKKSRRIMDNSDHILSEAKNRAQELLDEAGNQANNLVSQDTVVTEAYRQADQIIADAEARANEEMAAASRDAGEIRTGAMAYANDLLAEVEKILAHAYDTTRTRSQNLVDSLASNLEILKSNRSEISAQLGKAYDEAAAAEDSGDVNADNASGAEQSKDQDLTDYTVDVDDVNFDDVKDTGNNSTNDDFDYAANLTKSVGELEDEAGQNSDQ